jgi:hypothetical protein
MTLLGPSLYVSFKFIVTNLCLFLGPSVGAQLLSEAIYNV